MARGFKRSEILERLRASTAAGKPILGAGCSAGIIAKCAELGGADLIMVYSSGRTRIQGFMTGPVEDSNRVTLEMLDEISRVVQDTPIIAGIEAFEPPAGRDLRELVGKFIDAGFSGIINFPTYGWAADENWRRMKDEEGLGFGREIEMIRTAREMDVFTMAYVWYVPDVKPIAEAGVDCMVPHAGGTTGGLVGYEAGSLEEGAAVVQTMIEETKRINPEIICLAHGGPFAEPQDTEYLYQHTDAVGFVGASSIERIPVERAVVGVVQGFKGVPLKR